MKELREHSYRVLVDGIAITEWRTWGAYMMMSIAHDVRESSSPSTVVTLEVSPWYQECKDEIGWTNRCLGCEDENCPVNRDKKLPKVCIINPYG